MSGSGPGFRGLLLNVGRRRTEDIWPEVVARNAAGCFDRKNMLCWHAALAVDPSPHMALPYDLFFSGKESGQSALASDRCDCSFEM